MNLQPPQNCIPENGAERLPASLNDPEKKDGCVISLQAGITSYSLCGAHELIVPSWVRKKTSEKLNSVQVTELFFCQSLSEVTSSCSFLHVSSMMTGHFVCLLLKSSLPTDTTEWRCLFSSPSLAQHISPESEYRVLSTACFFTCWLGGVQIKQDRMDRNGIQRFLNKLDQNRMQVVNFKS